METDTNPYPMFIQSPRGNYIVHTPLKLLDLANSLGDQKTDLLCEFRRLSTLGILDSKVIDYAVGFQTLPYGNERRLLFRNALALQLSLNSMPPEREDSAIMLKALEDIEDRIKTGKED